MRSVENVPTMNILGKIALNFILWVLFLVLIPILALFFVISYVWKRILLALIIKFCKPHILESFSSRESFFATDRFWEDSRTSCLLIAIVQGTIDIFQFRENFHVRVVKAEVDIEGQRKKLFPKLTQIPVFWGGYFHWEAAKYFLIHEHIRQIDTPTDENGLKKFAGTVLSLPFPNHRPLWEILVFPKFSKFGHETNSAIVLRIHQLLCTDDILLKIVQMITESSKLEAHDIFTRCPIRQNFSVPNSVSGRVPATAPYTLGPSLKQNLLKTLGFPVDLILFFRLIVIPKRKRNFDKKEAVKVSWTSVHTVLVDKISFKLDKSKSAVLLGSLYDNAGNPDCHPDLTVALATKGSSTGSSFIEVPRSVILDRKLESNWNSTLDKVSENYPQDTMGIFEVPEDAWDHDRTNVQIECLNHIEDRLHDDSFNNSLDFFICLMNLMNVFPFLLTSCFVKCLFNGGHIRYDCAHGELTVAKCEKTLAKVPFKKDEIDLSIVGGHKIKELICVAGPYLSAGLSLSVMKFQDMYSIGLVVKEGLIKLSSSGALQNTVDNKVKIARTNLDSILETTRDENGFVSIPIL